MPTLLDDLQVNPVPRDWASIGKPPRRASSDVRLPQCVKTSPETSLMMALGNDGNPAMRWDRSNGDIQRRCGTDRSCDRTAEGAMQRAPPWEKPEITVPKVGRREGGGAAELTSGEPPIGENGLLVLGLCLMGLREELSLIFV
ncbi:hypothetical protein NL676_039232 [Syzygium grande]|nr:hypothetical protein NL676_039232 [Syzygium grande]